MFATSIIAAALLEGALLAAPAPAAPAAEPVAFVAIPAGEIRSTVRYEGDDGARRIATF